MGSYHHFSQGGRGSLPQLLAEERVLCSPSLPPLEKGEASASVREQIEANLPVYAECGGLMFLGRSLICQGHSYEMVGALSLDTTMQKERQAHGYSVLEATNALPWFEPGSILTGHEFHHSKVIHLDSDTAFSFAQKRGQGIDGKHDGVCYKGVIALYTHVNALASPHWAEQMVKQAVTYQKSKQ